MFIKEIRQEAVKAALATYSTENQSVVVSSKRNTAYLLPLNNAPPVLTSEEQEGQIKIENPFPVSHITDNSNKNSDSFNKNKSSCKQTDEVFSGRENFLIHFKIFLYDIYVFYARRE